MGYSFSQLIFVILGVIYGIITLYSLMRLIHIRKFASDSTLAKYFYILLTFQNILSGASFFLLGLQNFNFENISQGDTKKENRLFWIFLKKLIIQCTCSWRFIRNHIHHSVLAASQIVLWRTLKHRRRNLFTWY